MDRYNCRTSPHVLSRRPSLSHMTRRRRVKEWGTDEWTGGIGRSVSRVFRTFHSSLNPCIFLLGVETSVDPDLHSDGDGEGSTILTTV